MLKIFIYINITWSKKRSVQIVSCQLKLLQSKIIIIKIKKKRFCLKLKIILEIFYLAEQTKKRKFILLYNCCIHTYNKKRILQDKYINLLNRIYKR